MQQKEKDMNSPLKKYVIMASILILLWLGFFFYIYANFTVHEEVVHTEILANSREIGQQSEKIFTWFNNRQEVYVKSPKSDAYALPAKAKIQTLDGRILTMPVPIEVVKKLENEFENGVSIRFISNFPKNATHIPTADDNTAMLKMISEQQKEKFSFLEKENRFHYIRPILAQESCITCHTNLQVNELIGGLVVETNPEEFIFYARYERVKLFILGLIGSSLAIFLLYLLIIHIWRKYKAQGENLEYARSMAESMSHGTEVIISNVERIIKELARKTDDPTKAELLRTLQYMNEDLRQSSQNLAIGGQVQRNSKEELIHVDTFFRQCVQIFHAKCLEKELDLTLSIDAAVPIHVLGDAFHLRQVISMLLKNAVDNTQSGGIRVRIDSAIDIASRFSTKDLQHTPIHLLVEVSDTSKGYVITDQQQMLQNFAAKKSSGTFNDRAVIDLRPVSEMATMLNGSITVPQNSKTGATFLATVQVKMVEEEEVSQRHMQDSVQYAATTIDTAPLGGRQSAAQSVTTSQRSGTQPLHVEKNTQTTPAQQRVPKIINPATPKPKITATVASVPKPDSTSANISSPPKATASPRPEPPINATPATLLASSISTASTASGASTTPPVATDAADMSKPQNIPELPHDVRTEGVSTSQDSAQTEHQGPIHVIIGDCNVQKLTQEENDILAKANIQITLVSTGTDMFEILDDAKHGYSVVLLRELADMDITYSATRIRYLEKLGSSPVAIVIIAEDMVQGDMDVLRYFNVSTVDNFPRDAHIAAKVIHLALQTKNNQIFLGGQFYNKTTVADNTTQLFDLEASLENSKKDVQFIHSMCTMWIRFYPEQIKRLREVTKHGTQEEKLRVLRAIRNSASTVSLPMLWAEATRLEEKIAKNDEDIRYEKLFSVYEQTFEHLKEYIGKIK